MILIKTPGADGPVEAKLSHGSPTSLDDVLFFLDAAGRRSRKLFREAVQQMNDLTNDLSHQDD